MGIAHQPGIGGAGRSYPLFRLLPPSSAWAPATSPLDCTTPARHLADRFRSGLDHAQRRTFHRHSYHKERVYVAESVPRLDAALAGIAWEAIFVDDNSPDGTAEAVKDIAGTDSRVRCLRRVGRRGLAGACIEGMLSSASPFVAVMDADLQHDPSASPQWLARLQGGGVDLVAGMRDEARRQRL